jgi:hypothetical protein
LTLKAKDTVQQWLEKRTKASIPKSKTEAGQGKGDEDNKAVERLDNDKHTALRRRRLCGLWPFRADLFVSRLFFKSATPKCMVLPEIP